MTSLFNSPTEEHKQKNVLPRFKNAAERDSYLQLLNRKILRNPRDLLAHTQRIFLLFIARDNVAYFGAVIDLFIALGPRGLGLKKSILRPTYKLLNKHQQHYIQSHLHTGISRVDAVPSRHARLSPKLTSSTSLFNDNTPSLPNADQILRKARYKLAMGHEAIAQTLLEDALEADPSDMEIACELLELYRQHDQRNDFLKMTTRLAGKILAVQDLWDETEHYFNQRS